MTSKEAMEKIELLCESYERIKDRDAYDAVGHMKSVISTVRDWKKAQEKGVE